MPRPRRPQTYTFSPDWPKATCTDPVPGVCMAEALLAAKDQRSNRTIAT